MGAQRTRLEFRVELHGEEPRVGGRRPFIRLSELERGVVVLLALGVPGGSVAVRA